MSRCQVFFLLLFVCIWANGSTVSADRIVFSQTICRHGDRNILEPYKNDPFKSPHEWPGGFGQLTDLGKQQHYELGAYLAKVYSQLITSPDKIYAISTDRKRTIDSANYNLLALYPHQTIPIHTIPSNDDNLLLMKKQCDRFDYVLNRYMNEDRYKGIWRQNQQLIKYLEQQSGEKLETLTAIWKLYDTLSIERLKGKRLPPWVHQVMQPGGPLESMALYWYTLNTRKQEMKKLRAGFLLKDILERAERKAQGRLFPDYNLYMMFAHDTTIASLLDAMDLFETPHVPPYASCLLFETYETRGAPYMRLVNLKPGGAQDLNIPGCGTTCSLDNFRQKYHSIIPSKSFHEECRLHRGKKLAKRRNRVDPRSNRKLKMPVHLLTLPRDRYIDHTARRMWDNRNHW